MVMLENLITPLVISLSLGLGLGLTKPQKLYELSVDG